MRAASTPHLDSVDDFGLAQRIERAVEQGLHDRLVEAFEHLS